MESESAYGQSDAGDDAPAFDLPALGDGATLTAGDYLLELELGARTPIAALLAGLERLGLHRAALDTPPRASHVDARIQVTGRLLQPLIVRNIPRLRWVAARRLNVNLGAPLRGTLDPVTLLSEQVYETRFLTRMVRKSDLELYANTPRDPLHLLVTDKLAEGGWETIALSLLHDDVRAKNLPYASMTLWFGLLRWTGPESFVTDDGPINFEDVIAI